MDQMVNNIWLIWKLVCMLRTYRTCNPTVRFSKDQFNNKLLGDVTLLRVTPSVIWTYLIYTYIHTYIYIYIYIYIITNSRNIWLFVDHSSLRHMTI